MLFRTNHIYSVHTNPEAEEPIASSQFVREGFNLWAFAFTLLWVLYHRMWVVFGILVAIDLGFFFIARLGLLDEVTVTLCRIFVQLWMGFHANDLLQRHLIKRGYLLSDVVSGENEARAQLRFFDRQPTQPWGA